MIWSFAPLPPVDPSPPFLTSCCRVWRLIPAAREGRKGGEEDTSPSLPFSLFHFSGLFLIHRVIAPLLPSLLHYATYRREGKGHTWKMLCTNSGEENGFFLPFFGYTKFVYRVTQGEREEGTALSLRAWIPKIKRYGGPKPAQPGGKEERSLEVHFHTFSNRKERWVERDSTNGAPSSFSAWNIFSPTILGKGRKKGVVCFLLFQGRNGEGTLRIPSSAFFRPLRTRTHQYHYVQITTCGKGG